MNTEIESSHSNRTCQQDLSGTGTGTRRQRASGASGASGLLLCLLLSPALLGGCDGGLFGTGTGSSEAGSPADASAPAGGVGGGAPAPDASDSTPPPGSPPSSPATDGATTSGDMSTGGGTTSGESAGDAGSATTTNPFANSPPEASTSFDNTVATTGREDAWLKVLNLASDRAVVVAGSGLMTTNGASALEVPASGRASLSLQPGSGSMDIGLIGAGLPLGAVRLLRVDPISLGVGSLTTVVVHQDSLEPVVLLSTLAGSDDAQLALIRYLEFEPDSNPGLTLVAAGTETDLINLAPASADSGTRVTEYELVPAGNYRLRDGAGRYEELPIMLQGGASYTIIGGTGGQSQWLGEIDSDLE